MDERHEAAALLRQLEGLRLVPYRDAAGLLTVGYGHRCFSVAPIAESTADALLRADVEAAAVALEGLTLGKSQRVALILFVFNVGESAFLNSTMYRRLLVGDVVAASQEFARWVHVGRGDKRRVCNGLVKRRMAERAIFLRGDENA